MFLRPVLILVCGMLLFNLPTLIYKVGMFVRGLIYLLMCNDKKWRKPQDPNNFFGPLLQKGEKIERKTIYFVRHSESTWNDTFNKGNHRSTTAFVIGFIPGLIKALLYELYLILSGKLDSWFYDAPISQLGLGQAEDLSKFIKKNQTTTTSSSSSSISLNEKDTRHQSLLAANPGSPASKIVCSNLRRAVSTMAVGFRDRLSRRPQEKILIVPSLQEISRNPDALSITPAHTPIQASWIDRTSKICNFQEIFTNQVDMSLHVGNKPVNSNGLERMNSFCDFIFSPSVKEQYVIAGGHSLWFRSFFQTFLPSASTHTAKKKKIENGGIVVFDLMKTNTRHGPRYMVDPNSIDVVHGGFL